MSSSSPRARAPLHMTTPAAWRTYLEALSAELLADEMLGIEDQLSPSQAAARWMGNPPCTEADIAAVEAKLDLKLPASLRSFYLVSNGWDFDLTSYGGLRLLPVEKIGMFPDLVPDTFLWEDGLDTALLLSTEGEEGAVWVLQPSDDAEWEANCPEVVSGTGWMSGGLPRLFREEDLLRKEV